MGGLFRRQQRPLRALQVEITSRCSRACAVCPRSALGDHWREGDLSEGVWNVLEPDLPLATHIHLQGWGEPLLHLALRKLDEADDLRSEALAAHPFPAACTACPKMLGW